MGPATRYVVRSTGCGRFLGLVLIVIAIIILIANSGLGLSWNYRRWWPVLIIAVGLYLFLRHYWLRFMNRSSVPRVIENGIAARLSGGDRSWRPPGIPVIVMAIGTAWLLLNLGVAQSWMYWVIGLVVVGLLFIGGSVRTAVRRT